MKYELLDFIHHELKTADLANLNREYLVNCFEELVRENKEYSDEVKRLRTENKEAKEIIREFMKYEINEYDGSLEIHFEELKKQAEVFINKE